MYSLISRLLRRMLQFLETPAGVRAFWTGYVVLSVILKWGHLVEQDEGYTLTGAWQVSNGLVLYRDIFDYVPPGAYYLLAVLFWLFGASYAVAKIFSIILVVLGGYGVYRLGKHFALGRMRYLPPLWWLFLSDHHVLINYKLYVLVAVIWAVECILAARVVGVSVDAYKKRHWSLLVFAAGALSGIAVLVHHARGAAIVAAVVIFIMVDRRFRALPSYLAGLVIALLPLLAWPISVLWYHLAFFTFHHYLPFNRTGLWLLTTLLFGYALVGWMWQRWRIRSSAFTLLWHLFPVLSPLPLLFAAVYQQAVRSGMTHVRQVAAAVLITGSLGLGFASLTIMTQRIAAVGLLNYLRMRDPQLENIVSFIQANVKPDQPIFVAPYLPNFYFEAKRRNPTRYNSLIYGYNTSEQFADAAAALAADPPPVVVSNGSNSPEDPVTRFIQDHYYDVQNSSGVRLLRYRAVQKN